MVVVATAYAVVYFLMMHNFYYLHTHHSHGSSSSRDVSNCALLIHESILIGKTLTQNCCELIIFFFAQHYLTTFTNWRYHNQNFLCSAEKMLLTTAIKSPIII